MQLLAIIVTGCAKFVGTLVRWLAQIHMFLYGILPALLPPDQLGTLIRRYYDRSYAEAGTRIPLTAFSWSLEAWEERVLAQHLSRPDTILILGAGLGRESLALAQRGYRVIGLDIAHGGLLIGTRRAAALNLPVTFIQADFLTLPLQAASVGYILLSGVMYSAVPGHTRRQEWLRSLRTCLAPGGKLVLNFVIAREPETALTRTIRRCTGAILSWPGTNQTYQDGDTCTNGHFMHVFRDEEELRAEIAEAGATLIELNWPDGYAVLS
ncbi:MAG: class I SAM-dependent methyltransferase [Nitrospira sp.]|nr:class I SAM-dependent methyltransferase [Nitrospira sp.]